jgi:hypothetical protein
MSEHYQDFKQCQSFQFFFQMSSFHIFPRQLQKGLAALNVANITYSRIILLMELSHFLAHLM